jgi:L-iditol 2-dehydrogenase
MKAAMLTGKESIVIKDVPIPEIGSHEVLVKVKSAFVCGTDVRFFLNGKQGIDADNPRILGHEFAGVIDRVGKDVKGYVQGMAVAIAPNYGCGICDLCTSGHSEMCRESEALGVSVDGGFAEYVRIPEAAVRQGNISILPEEGISFAEAALAEPLSCVYNAYEKIGIFPGDTVLVIGSGPIGIMHCLVALMAGASKVFISDISDERMELARSIDSRIGKLPAGDQLLPALKEATKGKLADLVITAASVGAIQEQAFSLAGQNGRIMFFGGLPSGKSIVSLDTNEIHYKQLLVGGTTRQSLRQYRKCLDLIASKAIDVRPIITAESAIDDVVQAVLEARSGKGLKRAIVI